LEQEASLLWSAIYIFLTRHPKQRVPWSAPTMVSNVPSSTNNWNIIIVGRFSYISLVGPA